MLIIGNDAYPINTDFRVGVAYAMALMAGELTVEKFYRLWFPAERPADFSAAQEAVNAFYRCGLEADANGRTTPDYSFDTDATAIIAAFQREYGIDLTTANMHWWRFSALLHGLLSHSFTQRVQYRVCNPDEIKSKDVREQYRKLKGEYALDSHGQKRKQPTTLEEYNELLLRRARGEE